MNEPWLRATRVLALLIVAIFAVSALPAAITGVPTAGNASAASAAATEVKIGWLSEIINWNPMNIEMVEDGVACYLIYGTLFTYDQNLGGPVNDLATGYYQVIQPDDTMITTINITTHAYFRNKANPADTSHPLTANDVDYTLQRILVNRGGTWDNSVTAVTNITVINDHQIAIETQYPRATLIDDLASIPIIPEYLWSSVSDVKFLTAKNPAWLVGTGPFYFDSMVTGSWYRFVRAPNYYGAVDYPGVREVKNVQSILYTVYTSDSAMTIAMNDGKEDLIVLSGSPHLFLNSLGVNAAVNIAKQAVQEPGICDLALNAIPMENKTTTYGSTKSPGNPLLLDPIVRQAIAMTLDKDTIVNTYLFGLPLKAESVVQPGYWQKNITPTPFSPADAKALLMANGYADLDGDGYLEANSSSFPVTQGWAQVGTEISLEVHAPNTDPSYYVVAQNWVPWAAQAGIRFTASQLSETVMSNSDWYKAKYDIWVWHWGWGPEPLGGGLNGWLWSEMRPGGDNCQMPMGPTPGDYDALYRQALRTLDKTARKAMVDQLQQWIHDSYCENPPFYDLGLYGMTDERWLGWGNWSQHLGRAVTSQLLWLWYDLTPNLANKRPVFDTQLDPTYYAVVDVPQTFSATVSDEDGDPLTINWTFGDGATAVDTLAADTTTTPQTVTRTHTYTSVDLAGLLMTVALWDSQPAHEVVGEATVYVQAGTDTPPTITSAVTYDQPPPVYVDVPVTWSVSAKDNESGGPSGSGLTFTWVWGDGTSTTHIYQPTVSNTPVTDTATHSWAMDGSYNVRVYVWDGFGQPNDPIHNVSSAAIPYLVLVNLPPDFPVISPIAGHSGVATQCVAINLDPDPDMLRFAWDFGNGTYAVTEFDNSADPGAPVTSVVTHTWAAAGNYLVTVWTDDLTGGTGHNVSSSTVASIRNAGTNVPPTALMLNFTPSWPAPAEAVTFDASAVDYDSDGLTFYLDYGDGSSAVQTTAGSSNRQSVQFTHTYDLAGDYSATLYVNDSNGPASHNVSTVQYLYVIGNAPPVIALQSAFSAQFETPKQFTPSSITDPEDDPLSVWYDWGDGTPMTAGDPLNSYSATHTYSVVGQRVLTVYADDGQGHNVSATATVDISEANLKPQVVSISKSPAKSSYAVDEEITFAITVSDYEGDTITLAVDFGDGTTPHSESVTLTPQVNKVVNVTHSYSEGNSTAYTVTVSATDGKVHSDPSPAQRTTTVLVEVQGGGGGGISSAVYAAIAIIAIAIVALLAFMLMKRKKKGPETSAPASGVSLPEEPPKP